MDDKELKKAVKEARRLARKYNLPYYVIWESNRWQVSDPYELDTWFAGVPDDCVVYCTDD